MAKRAQHVAPDSVAIRLQNSRFFFPIRKARSVVTEILACEARDSHTHVGCITPQFLAVSTLAPDLLFGYCPRSSGSQKCDCFEVCVAISLGQHAKVSVRNFPINRLRPILGDPETASLYDAISSGEPMGQALFAFPENFRPKTSHHPD